MDTVTVTVTVNIDAEADGSLVLVIEHDTGRVIPWLLSDQASAVVASRTEGNLETLLSPAAEDADLMVEYVLGAGVGRAGPKPGGFYSALLDACLRADNENLTKIARGFPELAAAVDIYKTLPGSPELLAHFVDQRWWQG